MNTKPLKQTVIFITCAILTALADAIVFLLLFPMTSAKHQVFTDFIIETLARTGTNKTGELHLFYGILLLSVCLFPLLYMATDYLMAKKKSMFPDEQTASLQNKNGHGTKNRYNVQGSLAAVLLLTLVPNLFSYVLYGNVSVPLLLLALFGVLGSLLFKNHMWDVMILFIFIYYGFTALATLACRLGLLSAVTSGQLYAFTAVSVSIILLFYFFTEHHAVLQMPILLVQLLFPLLFLVYFVDKYRYRSQLLTIPFAKGYTCFFGLLVLASYGILLHHIRKVLTRQKQMNRLKDVTYLPLSSIICRITPVIIYIYHSFSAAPMYAQPDQHHHGEQMIPWQQVITLGQSLYKDYSPVSGLFPFVSGSIQHMLLNGTVSDYSPAISISMVLFCIVTMYLLVEHTGTVWGVIFAIFFLLPSYNRQYFVLPVLLLLFLPRLLKKPNRWMKVWLLSCFAAGLYYPLFGVALVMGTFPLLLRQIYQFIRSGELKKASVNLFFYVNWVLCLLPVIFSIPLLLRMLRHTLTYSSQTILADGISLWGQTPPDYFMTYLSNADIRRILYLLLRFLLPVAGGSLFTFLLSFVLINKHKNSRISSSDSPVSPVFFLIAGALNLIVSYSYTLVRADTGMLLSRTSYILIAVTGMFLPAMLLSLGKQFLPKQLCYLITVFALSLPMIIYHQNSDLKRPDMWIYPDGESALILDDGAKVYNHYEVPDSFVRSYDSGLSQQLIQTLGEGFMVSDQLHYLSDYSGVMAKCEQIKPDMTYLGLDGQGFYYYLNARACGTGFIQAAKGFSAQSALLSEISQKRPVVFLLEPESNYYIYYYIMTHDYLYVAEDQALYPRELYEQLFDRPADDYRETCESLDLGLVAASFGNSVDTLMPHLTPVQINNSSNFKSFQGTDCDCLLLRIPDEIAPTLTSVYIDFTFDRPTSSDQRRTGRVSCTINGNTLLIPVGMNCSWLLSTIDEIEISAVNTAGETLSLNSPDISCEFYKIQQPEIP